MGKGKRKGPKVAQVKKMIKQTDPRMSEHERNKPKVIQKGKDKLVLRANPTPSSMFFRYNTSLGPPYHILLDTNFINFSISNKLDVISASMDCLFGKCIPCITDCVIGELEKLGLLYRVALRMAKDPRFERLTCTHSGTYADDCIVSRIMTSPIYIVATCDKDLKRRIRKVPGVPLMSIKSHKFYVERLPDAFS